MRIYPLFVLLAVCLVSCRKGENAALTHLQRTDFFADERMLFSKVQAALETGERLQSIDNVSYIDSKKSSLAVVFYRSDKREGNVVMRKEYAAGGEVRFATIRCEGSPCDCKVQTYIGRDGDAYVQCSCTSCTMLIY